MAILYTPARRDARREFKGHIGTRDAARVLGVTTQQVRNYIRAGLLEAHRMRLPEEELGTLAMPRLPDSPGDWRIPVKAWKEFLLKYRLRQAAGR